MDKSKDVERVLRSLDLGGRGWMAVDFWPGDLTAIGIVSRSDRKRLVYLAVPTDPSEDEVFYQLERHEGSYEDDAFEVVEEGFVGLAELPRKIRELLGE